MTHHGEGPGPLMFSRMSHFSRRYSTVLLEEKSITEENMKEHKVTKLSMQQLDEY